MKTIYLIRHGESDANASGIMLGSGKVALTERGKQQASFVAERLSKLPVELVVASDYLRAQQTAEIISEKVGKPLESSELFGEWKQGTHRIGKSANDPETILESKSLVEHLKEEHRRVADEQNFDDLNKRAGQALVYLIDRPEQHIAVVSHGWFSPVLLGKAVMGDDFTGRDCEHFMKAFRFKNTGITILTHESTEPFYWTPWNVITWNDHSHLADS